ncbi:MAG: LacI family transcriptional regulator [Oscillospiraceae bacterium]|nr:LacI family transcriptional regulator [Oscillospiraceae bacterium]
MGVTIKDVATAAGVSISTVSKVLNGHYSISQETQERVRQVIRDLNYYPSASAQSFAKGATRSVIALADLGPNAAFSNPHMFEIIAGLEEALRAKNYRLILCGAQPATACEMAEEFISRRSADALAVHVSVMTHQLAALLVRTHFPHIVLGLPNFDSQVCWIDINNVYSGIIAAAHLAGEGYRRIAFLGGQDYDRISAHRQEGVRQGLEDAGLALDNQYIWQGDSTWADGQRMTRKLLSRQPLPDAVVCANNYIALGCVSAIQEQGLAIPGEIAVMTFDDHPFAQIMEPPLTVVDIDVRGMGSQAGRFLLDIIRHPNTQVQTYVTTSNLMARQSTVR